MVSEKLTAADIFMKETDNDADVLIIETAYEQFNTTIVIRDDVESYIILTVRTPTDGIIYFFLTWTNCKKYIYHKTLTDHIDTGKSVL